MIAGVSLNTPTPGAEHHPAGSSYTGQPDSLGESYRMACTITVKTKGVFRIVIIFCTNTHSKLSLIFTSSVIFEYHIFYLFPLFPIKTKTEAKKA